MGRALFVFLEADPLSLMSSSSSLSGKRSLMPPPVSLILMKAAMEVAVSTSEGEEATGSRGNSCRERYMFSESIYG